MCVGGGGGGGDVCVCGGGGSRRFNHSNIYRLQYLVCRPVLAGGAVFTNAFNSHNACWYMRALNNNGNEHRRKIKIHKNRKNYVEKVNVSVSITKRCVK